MGCLKSPNWTFQEARARTDNNKKTWKKEMKIHRKLTFQCSHWFTGMFRIGMDIMMRYSVAFSLQNKYNSMVMNINTRRIQHSGFLLEKYTRTTIRQSSDNLL
jgi:hypothetical protein